MEDLSGKVAFSVATPARPGCGVRSHFQGYEMSYRQYADYPLRMQSFGSTRSAGMNPNLDLHERPGGKVDGMTIGDARDVAEQQLLYIKIAGQSVRTS